MTNQKHNESTTEDKFEERVKERFEKKVKDRDYGRIEYVNVGEIRAFLKKVVQEAREDERKLCQEEFNMYQRVLAKSNEMQKKYFDK